MPHAPPPVRPDRFAPARTQLGASLRALALPTLTLATLHAGAASAAAFPWNLIIGGRVETGYPAVGAFLEEGRWFCTGTVVAPRVVLTAAHCLNEFQGPEDLEFFLGDDANLPDAGRRIPIASLHVHPDYARTENADIAVALLAEDADVEPMGVRLAPMDASVVGRLATFVGFGFVVQEVEGGAKHSVEIAVSELNDYFVGYSTPGLNTCQGDSGGPAFLDFDGEQLIVGVTSFGDALCAEDGFNTRTDVFAAFVSAFLDGSGEGDEAAIEPDQIPIEPGTEPADLDFCDFFGWYGDGYCDQECARPDPDCEGEPAPEDDLGADDEDFADDEGCAGAGGGAGALLGITLVLGRRARRGRRAA